MYSSLGEADGGAPPSTSSSDNVSMKSPDAVVVSLHLEDVTNLFPSILNLSLQKNIHL